MEDNLAKGNVAPRGAQAQSAARVDDLYVQSLQAYQEGRWQDAMSGFQQVLQLDPGHIDATVLLEEARLKASLDTSRPKPRRGIPRWVKLLAVTLTVIVFLGAAMVGVYVVNRYWLEPQQRAVQQAAELAQALANAEEAMANRDYVAAELYYQALLDRDPGNAAAVQGIEDAKRSAALATDYDLALQAIGNQNWSEAERILADILQRDPAYRDASLQLANIQQRLGLADQFLQAEQRFADGDWTEAIIAYEVLRSTNSEYEKETVTDHLFESYLKQGTALIDNSKGTEGAVREAQSLYQKTLTLRPQNAEALRLIALSNTYLQALSALARGDDAAAQAALERLLADEPDYAGGNAAVLLQELTGPPPEPTPTPTPIGTAVPVFPPISTPSLPPLTPGLDYSQEYAEWMQRGDAALAARSYDQAELTYLQAAQAAVHGGKDSAKWLFIAYAKAGTASARGGNYQGAVDRVQTAIRILARSAVAIPTELYSEHVAEGDAAAKRLDYAAALAAYSQVIRIMSSKCHCGLEDWSILP